MGTAKQRAASRLLPFRVPIFHMASMARSGETVMLRALQAHSRIEVVHNLRLQDSKAENDLFQFLKGYTGEKISIRNKHVRGNQISRGQILVLKQSVWEHPAPFRGFVLARNPLSIFASLKFYDVPSGRDDWKTFWPANTERFTRWLTEIDPKLIHGFEKRTPAEQFCLFYNRRMSQLRSTNLPITHYETFVLQPESSLRRVLGHLALGWEDAVLESHTKYQHGEEGHGKNDLSKPISPESNYRYCDLLTDDEFMEIKDRTRDVAGSLGYTLSLAEINIDGHRIPKRHAPIS